MAQKTEKEETEFKLVAETITPCINNCGVTGTPATKNMCQNCSTLSSPSATSSLSKIVLKPRGGSHVSSTISPVVDSMKSSNPPREKRDLVVDEAEESLPVKRPVNRCSGCRKKVGLTGFRCRCGELFCSDHRYSDRHECGFDYKLAGREAIARENPVVKAAKVVKI